MLVTPPTRHRSETKNKKQVKSILIQVQSYCSAYIHEHIIMLHDPALQCKLLS